MGRDRREENRGREPGGGADVLVVEKAPRIL
jgi:hypothetical protein